MNPVHEWSFIDRLVAGHKSLWHKQAEYAGERVSELYNYPQAMSDSQDTVAFVELEPAELAMIDLHDGYLHGLMAYVSCSVCG